MLRIGLVLLALGALGCVLPQGRQVVVDRRAGSVFSGDGILLEVSQDRLHCRVAYRNAALIVEKRWVPCAYVHGRPFDDL